MIYLIWSKKSLLQLPHWMANMGYWVVVVIPSHGLGTSEFVPFEMVFFWI